MKFGVRDICDVVFKAKDNMKIGSQDFVAGQPVLYIDTATASTLEQATTTVYAQGGKGNTRLVTWEGEKTLTFTVTDALLSPISLSILSGANLFKSPTTDATTKVHVHSTATAMVSQPGATKLIDLSAALKSDETIDGKAPLFISILDEDGDLTGTIVTGAEVGVDNNKQLILRNSDVAVGTKVFVDFYVIREASKISEIQIDATSFGGNFYVEASTLFRSRATGTDLPAEITIPNVKIQSNFTFSMSATGDPSTFDFTMDAMPGYTYFDNTKKVMCVIQVVEDTAAGAAETPHSVMLHDDSKEPVKLQDKGTADQDSIPTV